MEQAEPLGRRLGRRRALGLLLRVPGVELGDDHALLLDSIRGETARDRQRLAVVRQDLEGVPTPPSRLGHDLDRVGAVGPLGVTVQVAGEVLEPDEGRHPAGERGLDLTLVLAQLRFDERQPEEGVGFLLGREGPELGVIARERLAVLADPEEALLGQAPAHVPGSFPEADVVLLRAREMDAVRSRGAGRHHHEIDLRSAHDAHRGLGATLVQDLIDDPETGEALDQAGAVVGLGEEVEVADRLPLPAERAGRFDRADAGRARQRLDEAEDGGFRPVEQHPLRRRLEAADAVEDQGLGPVAQALERADAAPLRRDAEVVDGDDPQLDPDLADRAWSETRDAQQLDERRRDLGDELVVVGHPAGRDELRDLVADRGADTGDLGRVTRAIGGDEIDRAASDRVRRAVVRDGLEPELALDLEHVADVVEDPSEIPVREVASPGILLLAQVGIGRREVEVIAPGGRILGLEVGSIRRRIGPGNASGHAGDGSRDGGSSLCGDHAIAAGALGAVQVLVGGGDEVLHAVFGTAGDGHADRHAHGRHAELAQIHGTDRRPDAFADLDRDPGSRVPQQDDELLAAEARRHVVFAHG